MANTLADKADDRGPCIKCGACDRRNDGRCRPCANTSKAIWRAANKNKVLASDAAYRISNKEKIRAANIAWRKANPEKAKSIVPNWRKANPDKSRAASNRWHAENRDKARIAVARWAAANPEKALINNQNRRARKRANGGKLSYGLTSRLYKLQRGKCACCRNSLGTNFHRDHRMPLALGGSNTDDNMQLLCPLCNTQKHAKHPIDFMQQKGFLL